MNTPTFPYQYIAIEGNIGAGKTTFCQMLERDFGCKIILEQFADNPFLPYFYENPERYAFSVELFFMTERHKQLQENLGQQDLFQQLIVSDYYFIKTLLFARHTLSTEEYRLFQRLFNILNTSFPKPELLVYLHRSPENLLQNIQNRGREYERNITPDYLLRIQEAYFDFFKKTNAFPIVIIDLEDVAFWHQPKAYNQLIQHLQQTYLPGVYHLKIHP